MITIEVPVVKVDQYDKVTVFQWRNGTFFNVEATNDMVFDEDVDTYVFSYDDFKGDVCTYAIWDPDNNRWEDGEK